MDGVAAVLQATLSADGNQRIAAELKLNQLFANTDTGLILAQLVHNQSNDLSLRQSASIVLRKYILERWSPYFPNFKGNAPPVEIKSQIRTAIFECLSDPNRKIRSISAHVLSSIANSDWPEEYPDLLTSLIQLLSSSSSDGVHGAMQVFAEFIKSDLTEDQILPVLRELLPVLLNILADKTRHAASTRARTVSVFTQCVEALYMVKDQYPQPIKEATATVLPHWLEAFKVLLSSDAKEDVSSEQNWENLAVRIEIFRALDNLHTTFPRNLAPFLKDYLNLSIQHLHSLHAAFIQYYIAASDSVPTTSEDETIDLPRLICPILDFVANVIRGGKARDWFVSDNTSTLVSAVFEYVQMTDEDVETWASNANIFVAQEDDDTQPYSVRVAGFDLLDSLLERNPASVSGAFQDHLSSIAQSAQQARESGKADWWRPLEAALAAVGSQADTIIECIEDEVDSGRPKPIDIESFLSGLVPSLLTLTEFPFLQGRSFVFSSQYAKLIPSGYITPYLDAAVQVVENQQASVPVKISAVKALHNFYQGSDDNAALVPVAPRIAEDLYPFLAMTTDDTLTLVLETIASVLSIEDGSWLTPALASSLVSAVLAIWQQNAKDPIFLAVMTDILETISSASQAVYETTVSQALPPLSQAIASATVDESYVASAAIELVSSLVEGAKEGKVGEGFFALLAPALFKCLAAVEDRDVLQNGIACLTLLCRRDINQVLSWSDESGRSGLDNVLQLVAKLLQSPDESGGLVIGDLIIHMIRRAGDAVLPVLPQMLQSMVGRMVTAKTVTFIQSLVIPFAYLIHSMQNEVLGLLESTNINGRSGLDILMQTWCENAETFQGFWPTRVSTLALAQLYLDGRPSLSGLLVKGDYIVKEETKNVIMTRSRTKAIPHEFTTVAFPVKAIKLLANEAQREEEGFGGAGRVGESVDDADSDEDWSEDEAGPSQGFKPEEFAMLSEMLGPRGVAFDNGDILQDNDDEDLKQDPISKMDMQTYLKSFFRDCAQQNKNNFSAVVPQLKEEEQQVVQRFASEA